MAPPELDLSISCPPGSRAPGRPGGPAAVEGALNGDATEVMARAERQYHAAVEPENRIVARPWRLRWNQKQELLQKSSVSTRRP